MSRSVIVRIQDQTTPIATAGFGLPLIFVPDAEVEYQRVNSTDEITGLTSGDMGYDMASTFFSQDPNYGELVIWGTDLDATEPEYASIEGALDYLKLEHNEFYFVLMASRVTADIQDTADWVDANDKLFIAQNDISDSVSDIKTMAEAIVSNRTGIYAHDGGEQAEDPYLDAGIVGVMSAFGAGEATWKFKTVSGIPLTTYSVTDQNDLIDSNVNTYVKEMGVNITNEGLMTDGGFIDNTRSIDWLDARITESLFFLLYNSSKVPYDDPGISSVVGELKTVLKRATNQGIIALNEDGTKGLWDVTWPTRDEIASTDIANRLLPDIEFTATVAGAVHDIEIDGVLQV